ncbi:MAG: nitrilase-related carbon-nitrogen hydrolase, partial [Fibrobacterota bacterium]
MRTALCQINTVVGDLPGNLSKIQKCIKNARSQSCEVAVFPELAISGYPPEDLLMRRGFLRNCEESLREAAAAAVGGITVFLGCPVFNNGKVYNICAVLRGGKIVHEYKKIALPNYSVFDEKRYFEPGSVYGIVPVNGGIVGISVCEDIWDRNHQVESLLKEKISFLVNISASPFHAGKISQRKKVLRNTALKCSAPVLYCNLVGGQDELVFDGGSM